MDSLAWLARWLAGLEDSWHAVPAGSGSVEMSLAVQMSLVELRATGRIRVRASGWTRVALAAPSSKTSAPSQN
uniref:Uncharacterized protein n=1 Tax=Caenorhabditis japonica TaxID=281687 RepID=A0A8R1E9S6_CAEJA